MEENRGLQPVVAALLAKNGDIEREVRQQVGPAPPAARAWRHRCRSAARVALCDGRKRKRSFCLGAWDMRARVGG